MIDVNEQQLEPEPDADDAPTLEDLDAEVIAACVAAEEDGEEEPEAETGSSALPDSVRLYFNEIAKHPLLTKAEEVRLAKLKDIYLPYKLSDEEARGLSREQRGLALWEKIKHLPESERQQVIAGDKAFDQLVKSNLRLVVSVCKRYTLGSSKLDLMDLVQEGNIGLMRAVELFDHRKGFKFSTYATFWIRQACQRALGNDGRTIRLPLHIGTAVRKMRRIRNSYVAQHGIEPTKEQLASLLKITVADLEELERTPEDASSLNAPLSSSADGDELGEIIEDGQMDVGEELMEDETRKALDAALGRLSAFQRQVVKLRWGIGGDDPRTLEEVGRLLGTTREAVRAAELKAHARLRSDRTLKTVLGVEGSPATEEADVDDVLRQISVERATQHRAKLWTDEKIEEELRRFVGNRPTWPSKPEFAAAGKQRLYRAVCQTGGHKRWAVRLGIQPSRAGKKVPGIDAVKAA